MTCFSVVLLVHFGQHILPHEWAIDNEGGDLLIKTAQRSPRKHIRMGVHVQTKCRELFVHLVVFCLNFSPKFLPVCIQPKRRAVSPGCQSHWE